MPAKKKTPKKKVPAARARHTTVQTQGQLPVFSTAAQSVIFRRCYVVFGILVLFATTLLWAIQGAHVQGHNADQLSDPYLFSTWATFKGALFPGSHTQLLKWPIFWLVSVFGVTSLSLVVATVATVLVTVGALALVLHRIDRRPLIFGTVCLGLSLALLLVPAQPYAGGLLPVNMAMLTTRNIEYIIYMAVLILIARAQHIKSWSWAAGAALLSLLVASDKLFLSLSLGGALLALVVYSALKAWNLVTFSLHWLAATVAAAVGSSIILAAISASHLTHLAGAGGAGPYAIVSSGKDVLLGITYGVLGLLTNVGANPVYDNLVLRKLPSELLHRLLSLSAPAYIVAGIVFAYALVLAWRLAWRVPRTRPQAATPVSNMLALSLIWSTVAAFGVFVATNHYYEVDARYLTIGLFALAVTISVELRTLRIRRPDLLLVIACCLVVAIGMAARTSVDISQGETNSLSKLTQRNNEIVTTLKQHKVSLLVGSYWRVLPVKMEMQGHLNTMPLASCTQPDGSLTSSVWQPNLHHTAFAYLLTLSGSVAGFPDCSISQVVAAYGRPNATQVIAGSPSSPAEAILFYDRGSHRSAPVQSFAPTTILPITPDQLIDTQCTGPTVMNVVAHEDDDLLFMNPDLLHEIHAGDCMRTIYLTAGNDGQGRPYWLSRQVASEAGYNSMLGTSAIWVQRTVRLATNEYVTIANPRGNYKVSLIFFNLPDGNLQGQGFPMSNFESLQKLLAGTIHSMNTVDKESSYTAPQLVSAIQQLMMLYRPSLIQTQANVQGTPFPDHSDHIATGNFTVEAAAAYNQEEFGGAVTTPLRRYVGYPIHSYPANVSGTDLQEKEATFMAYAHFDGGVCQSLPQCEKTPTYWAYLTREYVQPAS